MSKPRTIHLVVGSEEVEIYKQSWPVAAYTDYEHAERHAIYCNHHVPRFMAELEDSDTFEPQPLPGDPGTRRHCFEAVPSYAVHTVRLDPLTFTPRTRYM